jgi:hypothetical protein
MEVNSDDDDNDDNDMDSIQKVYLYLETMCLHSLLSIYRLNKLTNKSKLDKSKFNIELLMQILQTNREEEEEVEEKNEEENNDNMMIVNGRRKTRSTTMTTTGKHFDRIHVQEHILLLLSEIASIFPDKVLEHVLIMFVFVGNKLARKDDSYSFQIINKIIETILPAIVNSVNSAQAINNGKQDVTTTTTTATTTTTKNDKEGRLVKTINVIQRHQKELPYVSSLVCKILQSFVVALPHIPAHRKAIIFNQLLQIIG